MKKLFAISLLFVFSSVLFAQETLEQSMDAYMSHMYGDEGPGATILVAKNGKPIYRKAFGLANLEVQSQMSPENVFELGSITKQFTSVSILMLEEQGKLSLDDEITKYIPDYPTHDKKITIHHLLNHTSGIKSYTGMQSFMELARQDMIPEELIDVFKNEPMDFDPGDKFLYNNSGYILLGYIIENLSGMTYEEFVEKNIFEKLGMSNSYYGKMKQIIPNRASGYQVDEDSYQNAEYLSLTLPYAAGSLMSTVDDLLKWQNAINANELIKRSSLEKAINGSRLNNGEEISYGYGWVKGNLKGSPIVSHGGGIFGFTTNEIYFPEEDIYVVGLSNCNCKDIGDAATKIGAMAIGKSFPNVKDEISLSPEQLKKWVSAYQYENAVRHITMKEGKLYSQREGSTNLPIFALSENHFIFEGGTTEYHFSADDTGKRNVVMNTMDGTSKGIEIDKDAPKERVEINVDPITMKKYVGQYEIQPEFILTITYRDGSLYAQGTNQPEFPLFAESESTFFLKVVPASIDFKLDEMGEAESLILHQGGASMPAKKLED